MILLFKIHSTSENKMSVSQEQLVLVMKKLCEDRLKVKRSVQKVASGFSNVMVACMAMSSNQGELLKVLDQHVDSILDDCEIYFNMGRDQVDDARQELSNLATIYSGFESAHYYRCCRILSPTRVPILEYP